MESLEQRYPRFPGLNLTFEVREGIVKHSRDFAPGEIPELDEYLPGLRPPLEAQLIDLADEIAYNAADLDDAYEAGLLTPEQHRGSCPRLCRYSRTIETQFPGATERERFQESVRHLIDDQVSGFIEGTVEGGERGGREGFRIGSPLTRPGWPDSPRSARDQPAAQALSAGECLFFRAFGGGPARVDRKARPDVRIPARTSRKNARRRKSSVPVHRAVCDFIAGMTDRYFLRFYEALFK